MSEWKIEEVRAHPDAAPVEPHDYYNARRPFVVDGEGKRIFWGPQGHFHHDLQLPDEVEEPGYLNSGWTMHREGQPIFVSLYKHEEDNPHWDALLAMRRHVGDTDQTNHQTWRFGTFSGTWTPGSWGKGLVLNGQLYTWNTGTQSLIGGSPHHSQVAKQLGVDYEDFMDGLKAGENILLQIRPDGRVSDCLTGAVVPDSVYEQGEPLGLRRAEEGEKWHFGAWYDVPEDRAEPPEVVELEHHQIKEPLPSEKGESYSWLQHRRPFVYWPEDHQVVVGPPGAFHSQLGMRGPNVRNVGHGAIFEAGWKPDVTDRQVTQFGGVPNSVVEHLREHFDAPFVKETWSF